MRPIYRTSLVFILLLLLSLIFVLSDIDRVLAQSPTSTYWSIVSSSTPEPTKVLYSDGYPTPLGWGTVTPNAFWMALCNYFFTTPTRTLISTIGTLTVTRTGTLPTSTLQMTNTPTVTRTATATDTSPKIHLNILLQGHPHVNGGTIDCVDELNNRVTVTCPNSGTNCTYPGIQGHTIICLWQTTAGQTAHDLSPNRQLDYTVHVESGTKSVYYDSDTQYTVLGASYTNGHTLSSSSGTLSLTTTSQTLGFVHALYTGYAAFTETLYSYFTISYYDVRGPTVTPTLTLTGTRTPTATVTPYATPRGDEVCLSVNGTAGLNPLDNGLFGWTLPMRGEGSCWEWNEISLGTWYDVAVAIPEGSICFVPATFGKITLFENDINLDIVVGVMIAVMLIRWLWRS
jgi:hypothetical protein